MSCEAKTTNVAELELLEEQLGAVDRHWCLDIVMYLL